MDDEAPALGSGAFEVLDAAVGRAIVRLRELRARVREAEARREEVETLLSRMAEGEANPAEMKRRIDELEDENAELRRRLTEGRDGVERLLAKIRFLEEQR